MNSQVNALRRKSARSRQGEQGQTFLMFLLFMIVLIVFIGLGVDLGFAYITRARLSKAVDSACLTGMRNLYQGQTQAALVASNAFLVNYGSSGRDVAPPVLKITFSTLNSNTVIDVGATVSINTYFIRVLPQWKTLAVGSTAEATRSHLIMTLVLDTSGSMDPKRGPPPGGDGTGSGGGKYLPGAVTSFINNFDETNDNVGMVKFSITQTDVVYSGSPNHQPTQPFKSAIISAVNAFVWSGATFSQGGLTNGLVMENNATVAPGESVVKVVVFCTDGLANVVQDTLNCPPSKLVNFGGQDTGTSYGLYDPVTGNSISCGASQFHSAIDGSMKSLVRANISADATFRAVQVANQMRAAGIIVYAVGVGTGINATFLAQVANDPTTPGYVATSYDGEYVVANDVSQLSGVFQTIASKILLRLSK